MSRFVPFWIWHVLGIFLIIWQINQSLRLRFMQRQVFYDWNGTRTYWRSTTSNKKLRDQYLFCHQVHMVRYGSTVSRFTIGTKEQLLQTAIIRFIPRVVELKPFLHHRPHIIRMGSEMFTHKPSNLGDMWYWQEFGGKGIQDWYINCTDFLYISWDPDFKTQLPWVCLCSLQIRPPSLGNVYMMAGSNNIMPYCMFIKNSEMRVWHNVLHQYDGIHIVAWFSASENAWSSLAGCALQMIVFWKDYATMEHSHKELPRIEEE